MNATLAWFTNSMLTGFLTLTSHFVTVYGRNMPTIPTIINDILGKTDGTNPLVLTRLNIRPPYQEICHLMWLPQSMAQWTCHSRKQYQKMLPYAHMLRETRVWLKNVMNCLIPGLHCTDITRDRVCLVYALMTNSKLNIGAIIKSTMQKFRVHKGHGMHLEVLLLTSVIVQVYQKKI